MSSNRFFMKLISFCLFLLVVSGLTTTVAQVQAVDPIDGQQYYLWGASPTHSQPNGNGYDVGEMNKTRPRSWTSRNCSVWVQYFFDENGMYSGDYCFSGMYIRFWWSSYQLSEGIRLAYEVDGTYGGVVEGQENLTNDHVVRLLYTNGSANERKHSDYRLFVAYIDLTDFILKDDEVYHFNIWLISLVSTEAAFPQVVSPQDDPSFVIVNPPSNATLQEQDTDGDGASDYDELYVRYTDPKSADTFCNGWTDDGNPTDPYALSYPWRRGQMYFNDSRQMQTWNFEGAQSKIAYVRLNKYWRVLEANMKVASFPRPLSWLQANDTGNRGVAIGDVNNDGENEVIIGGMYGVATVWKKTPDGWVSLFSRKAGTECSEIEICDLNSTYAGNEFVLTSFEGDVSVYDSTFNEISNAKGEIAPWDVEIGDVDTDGEKEMVIGRFDSFQIYSSSFELKRTVSANAYIYGLQIGDANNDGKTEVLIGDWNDYVRVFNSSGDYANIKEWQVLAHERASRVRLADIDNDGKNEIVVGGSDGVAVYRLVGDTLSTLWISGHIEASTDTFPECGMLVADLDGDLKKEILMSAKGSGPWNGTIYVFDWQGNIVRQWNNPMRASGMAIGDVDNNGRDDIVFTYEETQIVTVYDSFPTSVSVDVGNDGSDEFSRTSGIWTETAFSISSALNGVLDLAETNWIDIPVRVGSTDGSLGVSFYAIYTPFSNTSLESLNYAFKISNDPFIQDATGCGITALSYTSDKFTFTIDAPSETTSTVRVQVGDRGEPKSVSGASSWSYNSEMKTLTVYVLHNSSKEITVHFAEQSQPVTTVILDGVLGDNDWFVSEVMVTLSVASGILGVEKTEYSFDNITWTRYAFPFTIANEGVITLYYKSTDKDANSETIRTRIVRIDKAIPLGALTINNDAVCTTLTSVTLNLTATDITSGISQMRFSLDNSTWIPWETYSVSREWMIDESNGVATVYVQFRDNAGLASPSEFDTIILDTTAPSISLISPNSNNDIRSSTLAVAWSGSDWPSGIDHYEIKLDSGSWINTGVTSAYTFSQLGDGAHTFYIKAVDKAGNTKQDTVNFTVNTSFLLGPGYAEETAVTAILIITAPAIVLYLVKKGRKDKPRA